jgi:hypothetical protein
VHRWPTAAAPAAGEVLPLPAYGPGRVFRVVPPDGDTEHWATNDPALAPLQRQRRADSGGRIEEGHRGWKRHGGVERCQARGAEAQRNRLGLALRACRRRAVYAHRAWTTWLEAQRGVAADLGQAYLTLAPRPVHPLVEDCLPRKCA